MGKPARIFFGLCAASVAVASIAFVDPPAPRQAASWAGSLFATPSSTPTLAVPRMTTLPPRATPTPAPTINPTPTPECGPGTGDPQCADGNPANFSTPTPSPAPSDTAGWVSVLPAGFHPEMVALPAELAVKVQPAIGSLHYTTNPPAYWTVSECDWLTDSLYADFQLDKGAEASELSAWNISTGWFYSNAVDEWSFMFGVTTQACWRGGAIGGEQAATAIFDADPGSWNGHPAHYATDAPGSFDQSWDASWTDAYMEMAALFLEVPQAPYYFCSMRGYGDAAASHCTAASVLASLKIS